MTFWTVTTKGITEVIDAADQWAAFDALRGRQITEFGLIVQAWPTAHDGDDDQTFGIRTSALFHRWGDPTTSMRFTLAALQEGLTVAEARSLPEWDEEIWQASQVPS